MRGRGSLQCDFLLAVKGLISSMGDPTAVRSWAQLEEPFRVSATTTDLQQYATSRNNLLEVSPEGALPDELFYTDAHPPQSAAVQWLRKFADCLKVVGYQPLQGQRGAW